MIVERRRVRTYASVRPGRPLGRQASLRPRLPRKPPSDRSPGAPLNSRAGDLRAADRGGREVVGHESALELVREGVHPEHGLLADPLVDARLRRGQRDGTRGAARAGLDAGLGRRRLGCVCDGTGSRPCSLDAGLGRRGLGVSCRVPNPRPGTSCPLVSVAPFMSPPVSDPSIRARRALTRRMAACATRWLMRACVRETVTPLASPRVADATSTGRGLATGLPPLAPTKPTESRKRSTPSAPPQMSRASMPASSQAWTAFARRIAAW